MTSAALRVETALRAVSASARPAQQPEMRMAMMHMQMMRMMQRQPSL